MTNKRPLVVAPYPTVLAIGEQGFAEIARHHGIESGEFPRVRGDLMPAECAHAWTCGAWVLRIGRGMDSVRWREAIQQAAAVRLSLATIKIMDAEEPVLIVPDRPIACQFEDEGRKWYIEPTSIREVDEWLASAFLRQLIIEPSAEENIVAFCTCWRMIDEVLERLCFGTYWGQCGPFVLALPQMQIVLAIGTGWINICCGERGEHQKGEQIAWRRLSIVRHMDTPWHALHVQERRCAANQKRFSSRLVFWDSSRKGLFDLQGEVLSVVKAVGDALYQKRTNQEAENGAPGLPPVKCCVIGIWRRFGSIPPPLPGW